MLTMVFSSVVPNAYISACQDRDKKIENSTRIPKWQYFWNEIVWCKFHANQTKFENLKQMPSWEPANQWVCNVNGSEWTLLVFNNAYQKYNIGLNFIFDCFKYQGRIQKFWKGGAQNSRVPNYRIPALTPFEISCFCRSIWKFVLHSGVQPCIRLYGDCNSQNEAVFNILVKNKMFEVLHNV